MLNTIAGKPSFGLEEWKVKKYITDQTLNWFTFYDWTLTINIMVNTTSAVASNNELFVESPPMETTPT